MSYDCLPSTRILRVRPSGEQQLLTSSSSSSSSSHLMGGQRRSVSLPRVTLAQRRSCVGAVRLDPGPPFVLFQSSSASASWRQRRGVMHMTLTGSLRRLPPSAQLAQLRLLCGMPPWHPPAAAAAAARGRGELSQSSRAETIVCRRSGMSVSPQSGRSRSTCLFGTLPRRLMMMARPSLTRMAMLKVKRSQRPPALTGLRSPRCLRRHRAPLARWTMSCGLLRSTCAASQSTWIGSPAATAARRLCRALSICRSISGEHSSFKIHSPHSLSHLGICSGCWPCVSHGESPLPTPWLSDDASLEFTPVLLHDALPVRLVLKAPRAFPLWLPPSHHRYSISHCSLDDTSLHDCCVSQFCEPRCETWLPRLLSLRRPACVALIRVHPSPSPALHIPLPCLQIASAYPSDPCLWCYACGPWRLGATICPASLCPKTAIDMTSLTPGRLCLLSKGRCLLCLCKARPVLCSPFSGRQVQPPAGQVCRCPYRTHCSLRLQTGLFIGGCTPPCHVCM